MTTGSTEPVTTLRHLVVGDEFWVDWSNDPGRVWRVVASDLDTYRAVLVLRVGPGETPVLSSFGGDIEVHRV